MEVDDRAVQDIYHLLVAPVDGQNECFASVNNISAGDVIDNFQISIFFSYKVVLYGKRTDMIIFTIGLVFFSKQWSTTPDVRMNMLKLAERMVLRFCLCYIS